METWPHHVWNPFIQFDLHWGIFWMPPSPIPIAGLSIHVAGGIFYMPLAGLGENKSNGQTILADGTAIVSRAHECKFFIIPHMNIFWPVPGFNLLTPLLVLASASKCEFAVGSVRGSDGPIAVSLFKPVGLNWSCQGFAKFGTYAPTCAVANWSTVNIGFTWGDLVASLLCGLFDALKSAIETFLFGKAFGWLAGRGLMKNAMMNALRRAGIPRTFNNRIGTNFFQRLFGTNSGPVRFSSMSEALNSNLWMNPLTIIYSHTVGGDWGNPTGINGMLDSPEYSGNPNATGNAITGLLTGSTVTGTDGLANRLGAYIDGNSEALGY